MLFWFVRSIGHSDLKACAVLRVTAPTGASRSALLVPAPASLRGILPVGCAGCAALLDSACADPSTVASGAAGAANASVSGRTEQKRPSHMPNVHALHFIVTATAGATWGCQAPTSGPGAEMATGVP